jgi:alkylation response protein AidB-like acyl-CoA dehydrogenase
VDRLGLAFAGGYAAALQAMVPALGPRTLASFAATEEGGAHPRAIATTLARDAGGLVLTGKKKWVTLGPEGGVILVVARVTATESEAAPDRPTLRVVRVDARAPGVTITPLPHMPFVPEIPHGSVVLDGVRVSESDVLPGDGYDAYLKPFRTVEDVHVHAAFLAWLASTGVRAGWPQAALQQACSLIASLRALASEPPSSPAVHVALGGVIEATATLVGWLDPAWSQVDEATRARWERDRPLLAVAGAARTQRLARAWESLAR